MLAGYMGAEAAGLGYVDRVHSELESLWVSSRLAGFLDEEQLKQAARNVRQFARFTDLVPRRGFVMDEELLRRLPGRREQTGLPALKHNVEQWYGEAVRRAVTPLNFQPNYFEGVSLHYRGSGPAPTPEQLARGDRFLLHMAKAVELSRPFLLLEKRFRAVFEVLDRLEMGVVVFGEDLGVWIRNEAASRILEKGDCLRLDTRGKLEALCKDGKTILGQAMNMIVQAGDGQTHAMRVALPRKHSPEPCICEVSLMGAVDFQPAYAKRGYVMLLVDPDRRDIVDFSHVQDLFGLTPKESQVGKLLARGHPAAEIAEMLNVSPNTVGTHKRALYRKVGVHTRVELVRLAHNINIPICGDAGS
ncbi:MAG: LuxR C-terminal-related transcriptional regulator [Halioglobus sp.]|nr:LuxR C-terminal-related transcriptional regulator [Halioglobus sp.]